MKTAHCRSRPAPQPCHWVGELPSWRTKEARTTTAQFCFPLVRPARRPRSSPVLAPTAGTTSRLVTVPGDQRGALSSAELAGQLADFLGATALQRQ